MAKVTFKRYETDLEAQGSDIVDGQFIVTKDGTSYIDYGEDRVPFGGTPDTQMSSTSQNAVQNKAIKEYVDGVLEAQNVYSTTETVIGTWLGKPLYRKVIDIGNLPNATSKSVNHGISNLGIVTKYYGNAESSNSKIPIPYIYPSAAGADYGIGLDPATSTTVTVVTGVDRSGYTGYVVLEYTKTTD